MFDDRSAGSPKRSTSMLRSSAIGLTVLVVAAICVLGWLIVREVGLSWELVGMALAAAFILALAAVTILYGERLRNLNDRDLDQALRVLTAAAHHSLTTHDVDSLQQAYEKLLALADDLGNADDERLVRATAEEFVELIQQVNRTDPPAFNRDWDQSRRFGLQLAHAIYSLAEHIRTEQGNGLPWLRPINTNQVLEGGAGYLERWFLSHFEPPASASPGPVPVV